MRLARGILRSVSLPNAPKATMSPSEYLHWERSQRDRYQFLNGEVYAMAGGSPRHNLLSVRVLARLDAALRGGPCRPFSSDQKIHIPTTGDYVYADGVVVCGPVKLHNETTDVIENPKLVVEVLSKSTERHDRDEKWQAYSDIPSLTDYVLVSQRLPRIEHYSRGTDGSWTYRVVGAGYKLSLSIDTILVVDDLYDGAFDVPGDG